MWEATIYGLVLAFGLILPLGVQNVFVFNQGRGTASFATPCLRSLRRLYVIRY